MSYLSLQEVVLDNSLCAGCGACSLVCPDQIIEYDKDKIIPVFKESAETCKSCNACVDVCPGKETDSPKHELKMFGRVRSEDERWMGIFQRVYGGRSTDPETFDMSASGGSATSLLHSAMEYMKADVALVMGRDEEKPWRSAPVLVRDPKKLKEHSQSTYQLAPYLSRLREVYEKDPDAKIVMSGIACIIQAVRKLQSLDTEVGRWAKSQIVFVVEVGCSSNTLPCGTESLIKETLGIPIKIVTNVRYRDGDYPGQIAVTTKEGDKYGVPFWKAVRHFKDNKTFRCLSCGDWLSGLADVSVADGDPNIFDASLGINQELKHGRVFIRSRLGVEVVRYAETREHMEVWDVNLDGMNLGLDRKRNRRATYEKKYKNISSSPVEGYHDDIQIIDDARYLALPDEREVIKKQEAVSRNER